MVKAIFAIAGGVTAVALILAIFAAMSMLQHRKPGVPTAWYAWNGYAFLTGRNFEPPAEPSRRLFSLCVLVFMIALVIGVAFALIGWPGPGEIPA